MSGEFLKFSAGVKNNFLKVFTDILKEENGRRPRNIYVRYLPDEAHVILHGIISDFERCLINHFGQEAIVVFTNFHERDSYNIKKVSLERINYKYNLKFYELE